MHNAELKVLKWNEMGIKCIKVELKELNGNYDSSMEKFLTELSEKMDETITTNNSRTDEVLEKSLVPFEEGKKITEQFYTGFNESVKEASSNLSDNVTTRSENIHRRRKWATRTGAGTEKLD